jgi:hypothetical protein
VGNLLLEFLGFVRRERKWWLVPMLLALGIVGVIVMMAALFPAAAPFVYTLF